MFYGSYVGFGGHVGDAGYVPAGAVMFDGVADYLSWTPIKTASSNTDKTISFWCKRAKFGSVQFVLDVGSNNDQIQFTATDALEVSLNATTDTQYTTKASFSDPSAWTHICVAFDTNNGTAALRKRLWINGTLQEDAVLANHSDPSDGDNVDWMKENIEHNIGRRGNNSQFFDGYLADFVGIDGTAYEAENFGEYHAITGVWVPKSPAALSYGTNGFWLNFADSARIGNDVSGNTQHVMTTAHQHSLDSDGSQTHHNIKHNGTERNLSQGFMVNSTAPISGVQIKAGSAGAGVISVRIETNSSGSPSGSLLDSNAKDDSFTLPGTSQLSGFIPLDAAVTPAANTLYFLKVSAVSGGHGTYGTSISIDVSTIDKYVIGSAVRDTANGNSDAAFTNFGSDMYFEIYQTGTNIFRSNSMGTDNISNRAAINDTKQIGTVKMGLDPVTQEGGTLSFSANGGPPGRTNTQYTVAGGNNYVLGTINKTSGKWYWEYILIDDLDHGTSTSGASSPTGNNGFTAGIADPTLAGSTISNGWGANPGAAFSPSDGTYGQYKVNNGTATNYDTSGGTNARPTNGDVLAVKLNLDDDEIAWGVNNTFGTDISISSGTYTPIFGRNTTSDCGIVVFDSEDFKYTPPSGYSALTNSVLGVGDAATLNNLSKGYDEGPTITRGGQHGAADTSGNISSVNGTIPLGVGKWYWEHQLIAPATDGSTAFNSISVGVTPSTSEAATSMLRASSHYVGHGNGLGWATRGTLTKKYSAGTATSYGVSYGEGDTLQTYLDMDNGKIYWGKDGTLMNSANLSTGTGFAFDNLKSLYPNNQMVIPAFAHYVGEKYRTRFSAAEWRYTPANSDYKEIATQNMTTPLVPDPSLFYNTVTYTGNGTAIGSGGLAITGVGFQPDFVWLKCRSNDSSWMLFDSVRGATKFLQTNSTGVEDTVAESLTAFNTDGFTLGNNSSVNVSSRTYVAFCMKAGGAAPTQTYVVKVVSDTGNKYRFDDFGTSAVALDLQEGGTYTFNMDDSSNATHPFSIGTAANDTVYTSGITYFLDGVSKTYAQYTSGFAAATTRRLIFTVPASAPALYYWCSAHSGMGGAVNTNSTFGSSNFSGSVQTRVTAASNGGFSIVRYTGTGSNLTIGHGLDRAPEFMMVKSIDGARTWVCYHSGLARSDPETDYIAMGGGGNNGGDPVVDDATQWQDTAPTTSVASLGTGGALNTDTSVGIAYCFAKTPGLIGIGCYIGNQGTATGPYVHVDDGHHGFKPAFLMIKAAQDGGSGYDWFIYSNKTTNVYNTAVNANLNEGLVSANRDSDISTVGSFPLQFTSTGFRVTGSNLSHNKSNKRFIYVAFSEEAFGDNIRPPSS